MKIEISMLKNELLSQGFVIIDGLVSKDHLDILYQKMIDETWRLIKEKKWGGVGALNGHLQQNPPRYAPYVFRDMISNPTIIALSKAILGDNFFNDFYSANTNCPGSIMQPVHTDCTSLWPSNSVLHPPVSLVINIPLVDVDEQNGSMEIWPGSHMLLGTKKFPDDKTQLKRKKEAAPIRANMRKGSILVRDVRTWHRGMPNISNQPRHMIAMMHHIHWFQRSDKTAFAKECKEEIFDSTIDHHIYFTEDLIDHSIDPTSGAYSEIQNI